MSTVIIGAGLAGARCAQRLRELGYDEPVILLGGEVHPPYDRPPLSKSVLRDGVMPALGQDWNALDVDLRLGEPVVALNGSEVVTASSTISAATVVIATGASAIQLPGSQGLPNVFCLRTFDDAMKLRPLLVPGARVAIIGAGWIGAETAAVASSMGCAVTVFEAGPSPLSGALPEEVGVLTEPWYEAVGVELVTNRRVASVSDGRVVLQDGAEFPADVVIQGLGCAPDVSWLEGSGVEFTRAGIVVDDMMRTNATNVWAIGDCANFPSARFGRRMTIAHREDAFASAAVAAANIVGIEPPARFDPVPYVWSEQFGRMLQYAGSHAPTDRFTLRGDPTEKWSCLWSDGNQLTAVLTVSSPREFNRARKLIENRTPIDVDALAVPDSPLVGLAAAT
jgi:3-phenylpropionate/trans-cinnamate dioxygenase ferredoxin reductase component